MVLKMNKNNQQIIKFNNFILLIKIIKLKRKTRIKWCKFYDKKTI